MARAETESGPGPIGQPSRHQRCRMELLPPYAWPGTTSHRLQPGPPSPGPDPQGPPSPGPAPQGPPAPGPAPQGPPAPGPAPQGPPPCAGQPPRSHPQALSRDRTGRGVCPQPDPPPPCPQTLQPITAQALDLSTNGLAWLWERRLIVTLATSQGFFALSLPLSLPSSLPLSV
ncbi:bcl-2-binding component 3 isoform X3 [Osmerus eperlanus]|uniref:bcl-2-binding component 3 isoform X3 n=1 Tax=Osmerus eperlanus TaxID=29151 RepID=UPI002E0E73AE